VTVQPLRLLGDPVLRTPCEPVLRFDEALILLARDLVDTVREPGRAGLAAPQIGVGLTVFAYNVDGRLGCVVNPEIVEASGESVGPEGCLSVPGVTADTPRAAYVVVRGVDVRGKTIDVEGTGELARCLQHETDHLAGRLYLDRLPAAERVRVMRLLRASQVSGRTS
jgi:peptide deformylase